MPPHTVIKQKYKVNLSEWLEQNYPTHKPSFNELKEKYTKDFIEDYNIIKPKSQQEFNQYRRKGTKGWQTVAAYHDICSWRALIKHLNLTLYFDMQRDHKPMNLKINMHSDFDFTL